MISENKSVHYIKHSLEEKNGMQKKKIKAIKL